MRLLLDTHIAIWAISEPQTIERGAARQIADLANEIYVSAVSIWEIAIKFGSGRPNAPPFSAIDAIRFFSAAGYKLLSISADHAARVAAQERHHGDPFDRMLVVQAEAIDARLVTRHRVLKNYGDVVMLG